MGGWDLEENHPRFLPFWDVTEAPTQRPHGEELQAHLPPSWDHLPEKPPVLRPHLRVAPEEPRLSLRLKFKTQLITRR